MRDESATTWTTVGNSIQVGKALKASSCEACQSACTADDSCKTMVFNQLLGECSLNYGDGPYRTTQLDTKYHCMGISSAHKTCDLSQGALHLPSLVFAG